MTISSKLRLAFLPLLLTLCACGLVWPSGHDARRYDEVVAAVSAGSLTVVRGALDRERALVRVREWNGATLLHDAVAHDELAMADLLLAKGADVEAKNNQGVRPLHVAAQNGNVGMLRLLIMHHAKVNRRDAKGWTALDRATLWKHPEASAYLKSVGGKPGTADHPARGHLASKREIA